MFFLGIDGGGSKTTCAIGDEASRLATVTTGASNITRVGETVARESLHLAIRQACAAANIDARQVRRACVGIAGAGRKETASAIRRMVADLIPAEIEVVGDMQIALEAAGTAPGVIVIAGTGSIAYGRDAQGRTARGGGWGFAVSDEGSAYWIGRATVAALLRATDQFTEGQFAGGHSTENYSPQDGSAGEASLMRDLKASWKVQSLDGFVRAANSNPDFAALFPVVVTAADAGSAIAQEILARAGRELAQLAALVIRRLFAEDSVSLPTVSVAMAGGVFAHSSGVREVFRDEVCKLDARLAVNPQVVEPVAGALEIARKATQPKQ